MTPNELVRLHNTSPYHAQTYGGAFGWNSKLRLSEVTPISDTLELTKQSQEVGNLNLSPPLEDRTFPFPQLPILYHCYNHYQENNWEVHFPLSCIQVEKSMDGTSHFWSPEN